MFANRKKNPRNILFLFLRAGLNIVCGDLQDIDPAIGSLKFKSRQISDCQCLSSAGLLAGRSIRHLGIHLASTKNYSEGSKLSESSGNNAKSGRSAPPDGALNAAPDERGAAREVICVPQDEAGLEGVLV
ncbi:hypothetical protein C8J57DRAFT_1234357 [Mycena rebaudengoi]|nr:hypothetical protein C8J57DRAFT_1234357 [Mycena rebaudengoi]